VPYLSCPTCRYTVLAALASSESCPRCQDRLVGRKSIFRPELPPTLLKSLGTSEQPAAGR
jgi:hypothetical protein